jgi:hypothetical protein
MHAGHGPRPGAIRATRSWQQPGAGPCAGFRAGRGGCEFSVTTMSTLSGAEIVQGVLSSIGAASPIDCVGAIRIDERACGKCACGESLMLSAASVVISIGSRRYSLSLDLCELDHGRSLCSPWTKLQLPVRVGPVASSTGSKGFGSRAAAAPGARLPRAFWSRVKSMASRSSAGT